jgi:2-phosphosulfolactate phosphatase
MKLHVLTNKSEIRKDQLSDKIVIVLDILVATSSIVTSLANGCIHVVPVRNYQQALALKAQPEFFNYKFSGELNADTLDGFIQPTPIALLQSGMNGQKLVYCTTNGTVALNECQSAKDVYVGSLLNAQAIVDHLKITKRTESILIVCSGSNDQFNMEDFYGAGFFVQSFINTFGSTFFDLSDSAQASKIFHGSHSELEILNLSKVGKLLNDRNWTEEVIFSSQKNIYPIVPKLTSQGYVELITSGANLEA